MDKVAFGVHLDEVVQVNGGRDVDALLSVMSSPTISGTRKCCATAKPRATAAAGDVGVCRRAGEGAYSAPSSSDCYFATAIIERYRRRESSVEEALIEMYWRRERAASRRHTQALWGTRVSASTVSDLNQKILRKDRRVARTATGWRVPVCVPGRAVAQALLGRRGEERLGAGGHWRGPERLWRYWG